MLKIDGTRVFTILLSLKNIDLQGYENIQRMVGEELYFKVREYVTKFAKIEAAICRNALYKKELMKIHNRKIPIEIIEHIANYAWDIMLLLYI